MSRKNVINLSSLMREEVRKFIDSFDTVLTDCDGVLWLENKVIDKSPQVINRLRELGKSIFYVTNNSTKGREDLAKKCEKMNYTCDRNNLISTSFLVADYLRSLNFDKKVYVVGSKGITTELDLVGIKHTEVGPDVIESSVADLIERVKLDKDVGAVVVGFDEHISFPKMLKAATYLSDPECLFVATNTDERFPMGSKLIVPGSGTMVAAVAMCSGRKPFIVGKPNPYICDALINGHNIDPKRTLMIGDKCNTDILLGTRCGFKTLLVMSGVTSADELEQLKNSSLPEDIEITPDFYVGKLGDLLSHLN